GYVFTPSVSGMYRVSASSSYQIGGVAVFRQTGSTLSTLGFITCSISYNGPQVFSATAGATYYLQMSTWYGGSSLQLNLNAVPPPANDNFSAATQVPALPFSDTIDTTAASVEPGEPSLCTTPPPSERTAWYRFTPGSSGSVSVTL